MNPRRALLLAGAWSLALGCAGENAISPSPLTSAQVTASHGESEAEHEIVAGDLADALATTERAEARAPDDPWTRYDRAVALEQEGERIDAAEEFAAAAALFAPGDRRGKAISLYGRAHALAAAGACGKAKGAYEAYADFVRRDAPQKAEMAHEYAGDCIEPLPFDPVLARASVAVVAGDYAAVLASTPPGHSPWVDYDRAVALAAGRRTYEAVAAYESARRRFGADHRWEQSLAIYGEARALAEAFRCEEAAEAYGAYASLVRATNPADADMAVAYARACHAPYRW